jgi:hypothetical protein
MENSTMPLRAALPATAFVLLALSASARGDAYHVPLDGSDRFNKAADFGYKVDAVANGKKVTVRIELNEDALKAFQSANITLTGKGGHVSDRPLKVERAIGGKGGVIKFVLDRNAVDGGHITIWSDTVKGQPIRRNFGGFSLSVEALLKNAVKVEPD